MQIDIVLEPNVTPKAMGRLGAMVESYGLGTVWTANHPAARDPFMCFAGVARSTNRVSMGPVAISPFELHPLKMANALLTLNELSDGRAAIVIGGGGGTSITMGLKPDRQSMIPNMVKGVGEAVKFLKDVSHDNLLTYRGEVFQISNYQPKWADQVAKPLVYVAASREKMLRMATQHADGVMMSDVTLPRIDDAIETIRAGLADNSRDPSKFRINNLYAWHVKTDKEEAYREARRKLWVRGMLFPWYVDPFLDEQERQIVQDNMQIFINAYITDSPDMPGVPDELVTKLVDNLTLTGDHSDLDRLIGELETFKRAGVTEIALRLHDDPEDSIRLIGETVAPALRN